MLGVSLVDGETVQVVSESSGHVNARAGRDSCPVQIPFTVFQRQFPLLVHAGSILPGSCQLAVQLIAFRGIGNRGKNIIARRFSVLIFCLFTLVGNLSRECSILILESVIAQPDRIGDDHLLGAQRGGAHTAVRLGSVADEHKLDPRGAAFVCVQSAGCKIQGIMVAVLRQVSGFLLAALIVNHLCSADLITLFRCGVNSERISVAADFFYVNRTIQRSFRHQADFTARRVISVIILVFRTLDVQLLRIAGRRVAGGCLGGRGTVRGIGYYGHADSVDGNVRRSHGRALPDHSLVIVIRNNHRR